MWLLSEVIMYAIRSDYAFFQFNKAIQSSELREVQGQSCVLIERRKVGEGGVLWNAFAAIISRGRCTAFEIFTEQLVFFFL